MGLAATLATVAGSLVLHLVLRPMEKRLVAAREQRRQERGEQLQSPASRGRLAALRSAVLEQATAGAAQAWRAALEDFLRHIGRPFDLSTPSPGQGGE